MTHLRQRMLDELQRPSRQRLSSNADVDWDASGVTSEPLIERSLSEVVGSGVGLS